MPKMYKNPILPGFHPDPSICVSPEGFWLINSSFEYFPGLPIYFSRDLVNWEQIGHVLQRTSQLPLDGAGNSQGLYAPTIRWHKGTFYVICTLINRKEGNFIVTSADPRKGWSEPTWILGAQGIDPSLFFDDDDTCWYVGQRAPEPLVYDGNSEIWLQEIDLAQMKLKGEKSVIWNGASKQSYWAEGPHIYKINGFYYVIASEGGTDFEHSISVGRSTHVQGPYESCKRNPIFTHRNLGRDFPIACTGHSDMVQTETGEWWMVMLGTRPYGGYYYNLGRETFLAPMTWEDGWPVICPGTGRLPLEAPVPNLPTCPVPLSENGFGKKDLTPQWQTLIRGLENRMKLENGVLELQVDGPNISRIEGVGLLVRRQEHINFLASCKVDFDPLQNDSTAGLCAYHDINHHIRIEVKKDDISIIRTEQGIEKIVHTKIRNSSGPLTLSISAKGQSYWFEGEGAGISFKIEQDGRLFTPFRPYGLSFTGTMLGIYTSGNEKQTWAKFSDFQYGEE